MNEYKSFYKTVGSGEGDRCHYPTRLDTYGCGCQHDCSYCYAKSLLAFRKNWNPQHPKPANIEAIRKKVAKIPEGTPAIRLGGMTDCFMPLEQEHRITYETIKALNTKGQPYLIVTKSALIAGPEYLEIMDRKLAHIQVTVTTTDDKLALTYEHASPPSMRLSAIETLYREGYDVAIRLSPYIPEYIDIDKIDRLRCDKVVVEFLRVNSWIRKWFPLDYSSYTVESGGYSHLPIGKKKELIHNLASCCAGKQFTVCEDEPEAYEYWKKAFNPNPDDCCNLRQ